MRPGPILTLLRNLALPRSCLGCGRPHVWWCPACGDAVTAPEPLVTGHLGFPVASACPYDGPARELVLGFKEGLVTAVAPDLAALLGPALAMFPDAPLVPIPSTRRGRVRRGFEPVRLILHHQPRPVTGVLRWERVPTPQKTLGRSARLRNLSRAMVADRPVTGVLLVDDVLTTGATLTEAARAVAAAGGVVRGAVVVCRTQP